MNNYIFYVGYYDIKRNEKDKRNIALAASNKMSYIIKAMQRLNYKGEVISYSGTLLSKFVKGRTEKLGNNFILKLFNSFYSKNKILRVLGRIYLYIQMFLYLLSLPNNSTLIVYHSLGYVGLISLINKVKRFKIILEVEEIYADVINDKKIRNQELDFFQLADAYIFPTKLLNDEINNKQKPVVFIHGTYDSEKTILNKKEYYSKNNWDHDRKHVLYAGTFDSRKGGAEASIMAAVYLTENYHMHILGFGNETEIKNIKALISKVSLNTKCKITYDGLLSGDDYIQFLQACDIGLSTQNPNAAFNDTSFPSKILSYMSNGLRVVSVRIPAIETSAIGNYMYYYDKQTPKDIANAIIGVNFNDTYDSREIIKKLDKNFCIDLQKLLEDIG